jgi:hypothetical protein
MASEHQLLHYALEYHIPKDSVGVRPAGERRSGPVWLLWLTLMALRYHFWQVVQFLLLGVLFCLVPLVVAGVAAGWLKQAGFEWVGFLTYVATWPVVVPVAAGLSHAILLVVQRYRPPWYEVVRPVLNLRLYGNVLMAGLPAIAAMWATSFGLMLAGVSPALGGFGQGIWANWVSRLPGAVLPNLMVLPFSFAGLDAVATWSPFGLSLRRNLRFAARNLRLLLGFGLVQVAIGSGSALTEMLCRHRKDWLPEGTVWLVVLIVGGLAAWLMIVSVGAVVHPMFYREFVWREREAG